MRLFSTRPLKPVLALAALLIVLSVMISSRAQNLSPLSDQERVKAINVVRLINTAELQYRYGTKKGLNDGHGNYVSWDDLYNSGVVKNVQSSWPMVADLNVASGADVLPGYHLAILVSPSGQSYSIALHNTDMSTGLFSVFSDQDGIIFTGEALH